MPAISVIMPVYNSEKYLSNAIESVLNQTFKDFELILVDDGSKDRSGSICDVHAEKDKRVIVIHKENGGISSARNAGIDASKGEYIAFIDNDDEYLPDLLADNYKLAKEYDADVVRFERKRIRYFDNGETKNDIYGVDKITGDKKTLLLKDKDLKSNFFKVRESGALFGIWNGIFRKSIINDNNLRFSPDVRFGGEDVIMNLMLFKYSNSYIFNKQAYYIYNRRESHSTSTKFNFNRIEALLYIAEIEKQIIDNTKEIKGLSETDLKWFILQIDCVIDIIEILSAKNCPWPYSRKRSYLKELSSKSILNTDRPHGMLSELYKVSKKKWMIGYLFYNNHPGILYFLLKIYFMLKS